MTQRPSGWYDDPHDETQLRYFDGIMWSDRTMPKLRPGLEHVGEARPESELPRHEEPHRRDGEPRTYPAHWGPEESGQNRPFAPPSGPARRDEPMARPGNVPPSSGAIAGLGRRFGAYVLDRILVGVVVSIGVLVFGGDTVTEMQDWVRDVMDAAQSGSTSSPAIPGSLQTALAVIAVAGALIGMIYDALMTTACRGRTVGRMAFGIAVVPADSSPADVRTARVSPGKAVLRAACKWVPAAIGSIGELVQIVIFLCALGNQQRAGLHDRAAKTLVRRS